MTNQLFLYLFAVLTLSLIPGPDMLYIISRSVTYGKRLGLVAALGIGSGCFVHIFAVSMGLSALLMKSATGFSIVKYVGTIYLLYLGITSFIKKTTVSFGHDDIKKSVSWKKIYWQGFLTNVLNPKVALFFLAFIPQFVDSNLHYPIALQMLFLGLVFNSLGTFVNILVAYFFGAAEIWLMNHPKILHIQQKITGTILIGFGVRLAMLQKI